MEKNDDLNLFNNYDPSTASNDLIFDDNQANNDDMSDYFTTNSSILGDNIDENENLDYKDSNYETEYTFDDELDEQYENLSDQDKNDINTFYNDNDYCESSPDDNSYNTMNVDTYSHDVLNIEDSYDQQDGITDENTISYSKTALNGLSEDNVKNLDYNDAYSSISNDGINQSNADINVFDDLSQRHNEIDNTNTINNMNNNTSMNRMSNIGFNKLPNMPGNNNPYSAYSNNNGKKRKVNITVIVVSIIIGCSALFATLAIIFGADFLGLSGDENEKGIEITKSMSTSDIAELLKNSGIIDHKGLFVLYSKGSASKFVYGAHQLRSTMSYSSIVEELTTDNTVNEEATVLIAEGFTLDQAAKALEDAGVCNAKEFIKAFNETDNEKIDFDNTIRSNNKFYKMEGYCYPLTYTLYKGSKPKNVADVIKNAYNKNIYAKYIKEIESQGYNLDEFMTIASIVQGEAPQKEQMVKVASVILNRLNRPDLFPRIESDTTNKYIRDVINIGKDDKSGPIAETYDTYKIKGLPPGPINNPGEDAIKAVLNPADTDYYYFCSDAKSGEFFYAKTLEEHQANLKKAGLD